MRHHLLNTAFWRQLDTLDQNQRLLIAEAVERSFRLGAAVASAEAAGALLAGRPRAAVVKWAARVFRWWCAVPPHRKWRIPQATHTDGSSPPPRRMP